MNINWLSAVGNAQASAATNPAQDTNDMFLQLLTTQLKTQSPLDPLNPTEFVGQLVQFNMLDQMIQIRQILQDVATPATVNQAR